MMSVGFLLASPSDAVIWRGPKKNGKRHLICCSDLIKAIQASILNKSIVD